MILYKSTMKDVEDYCKKHLYLSKTPHELEKLIKICALSSELGDKDTLYDYLIYGSGLLINLCCVLRKDKEYKIVLKELKKIVKQLSEKDVTKEQIEEYAKNIIYAPVKHLEYKHYIRLSALAILYATFQKVYVI